MTCDCAAKMIDTDGRGDVGFQICDTRPADLNDQCRPIVYRCHHGTRHFLWPTRQQIDLWEDAE